MEERVLEAAEYILMAINDIKDYKDFINYKFEIIKAINDIKYYIANPIKNINDSGEKKLKISSILGLQFDYDSLINENDIKFFSDYEDKTNKIKNKINSYFRNNNDIKIISNINNNLTKNLNIQTNKNILINPDKKLNCIEILRNTNKLFNKLNSKKENKRINTNKNILYNKEYLYNGEKNLIKERIENYFDEKKPKDKIIEIITKMKNEKYIYDILVKLYGKNIFDKLLNNKVNDEFIEAIQNSISEIENVYKKINNNINLNSKIEKVIPDKLNKKPNIKKELNINLNNINDFNKIKYRRNKRHKSSYKLRYPQIYQEFKSKNRLRAKTPINFYKSSINLNQREINCYSKRKNNNSDNSYKLSYHKKPFISSTYGYDQYFDEPLQKDGISQLDNFSY